MYIVVTTCATETKMCDGQILARDVTVGMEMIIAVRVII